MSLLQSLGIDITVIIQLGIAAVSFLILATAVFNAFQRSYIQRLSNTLGSHSNAEETYSKIEIVKQNYEDRVKALNKEIGQLFNQAKQEARQAQTEQLELVKREIETLKKVSAQEIETQEALYRSKKSELAKEVSESIYNQLVAQR